jgi:hypothetical protein
MSGRHPFEIFMLALVVLTSVPVFFGAAPEPGSIEAALPTWGVFAWQSILAFGSVGSLLGIFWRDRATGLIMEQLGMAFVGVASVIYSASVWAIAGPGAAIPGGIILGFGIACLIRWRDIQRTINAVHVEELRRRGEL